MPSSHKKDGDSRKLLALTQQRGTRSRACALCEHQEEVVAFVRRKSSAFTRGKSRFRGVSGQHGRWEARIGTFAGRKNVRRSDG
jgi:hypothetical protein